MKTITREEANAQIRLNYELGVDAGKRQATLDNHVVFRKLTLLSEMERDLAQAQADLNFSFESGYRKAMQRAITLCRMAGEPHIACKLEDELRGYDIPLRMVA